MRDEFDEAVVADVLKDVREPEDDGAELATDNDFELLAVPLFPPT